MRVVLFVSKFTSIFQKAARDETVNAAFNHQMSIFEIVCPPYKRILKTRFILHRFVKTFPCVAAYMSSLAIMAVAIDRYELFC